MVLTIYTVVLVTFHMLVIGFYLGRVDSPPDEDYSWDVRACHAIIELVMLMPLVGRVLGWW